MALAAAITVHRSPDDVRSMWQSGEYPTDHIDSLGASVMFRTAPDERGTEIHVALRRPWPGGRVGELAQKLVGSAPLAKVKDDLRRFKQVVETGEPARSEGTPEGERAERKLKQRPAQPLEASERERAGV